MGYITDRIKIYALEIFIFLLALIHERLVTAERIKLNL